MMCPNFDVAFVFMVTGVALVVLAAVGVVTGVLICRKAWNSTSWIIRRSEDPFFFWLSAGLYLLLGAVFIFHKSFF